MENVKTVYANNFSLATSQLGEVAIIFEVTVPQFDERGAVSGTRKERVADIRMTKELAKLFNQALEQEITAGKESQNV